MEDTLRSYHHFRECILRDVVWLYEGFRIRLFFNVIWKEPGELRDNLEAEYPVAVTFEAVRDFEVRSHWNAAMLAEPERLHWGMSEVALVEVADDPDRLRPLASEKETVRHVAVRWESDLRRMDIICSGVDIREL